jgi:hypothetical protein
MCDRDVGGGDASDALKAKALQDLRALYRVWMRDAALGLAQEAANMSLAAVDLRTKANG